MSERDSHSKNVLVIVSSPQSELNENYEISFSNIDKGKSITDMLSLTQKLVSKSETVRDSTKSCDLVFKRQSQFNQDMWVIIGKDFPVKDGSILQYLLRQKANLNFRVESM